MRVASLAAPALAICLAALAPGHASVAATAYNFVNFDVPASGSATYALGINDAGQVVGYSAQDSTFNGGGFLRNSDGSYSFLVPPTTGMSNYVTEISDINNAGQIVGYYYKIGDSAGSFSYLRDPNGAYTILKDPVGLITRSEGINDVGQIVGFYENVGLTSSYLFLRNPDGSYITLAPPNATNYAVAFGINNPGQIVGEYIPFGNPANYDGFLRNTDGTYIDISVPIPNANYTSAQGINDSGQIVGYYYYVNPLAGSDVTIYGQGFARDAAGNYTTISDPAGLFGSRATAINDAGQILGLYFDNNGPDNYGVHAFVATPVAATTVPEPAGLALLGTSLFSLRPARRRASAGTVLRPRRLFEQGGPGAEAVVERT